LKSTLLAVWFLPSIARERYGKGNRYEVQNHEEEAGSKEASQGQKAGREIRLQIDSQIKGQEEVIPA
jgi:hypothetical protein